MNVQTIAFYSIVSLSLVGILISCALDYRAQRFRQDEAERAIILRHVSLTFAVAAILSRLLYLEVG